MRRLTLKQRQAIQKAACLILSLAMFAGAVMAVPFIASALPRVDHSAARTVLSNDDAVPTFAFGAGDFERSDAEAEEPSPEEPIPAPTPGPDDLSVTASNLCWYDISEKATLNIINRTNYNVDLADYLARPFPVEGGISQGEPVVLIVHTHGTESYLPAGQDFYSPEESFRSETESETVVHIGALLCEKLNSLGIPTVHDRTMYDLNDFSMAYTYSKAGITEALEEYPSIRFVIDLHRDSVFDSAGNNVKPLTTIDGKDCAQLMLVVGTDGGGGSHPNWEENLTFAAYLQQEMNELYPTLARPVNLRTSVFNQALTKGSIILETGSCGNTVEEAENSILLFAEAYAALLKEQLPIT